MEESGGIYCSLCNMYHGVYSQTMSPGKDMYKFSKHKHLSPSRNIKEGEDIYNYLYVESFICTYTT